MDINRHIRHRLSLQTWAFVVLFLTATGLAAWLTIRYDYRADWTAGSRQTLSPASIELLKTLDGPITVTAFARQSDLNPTRERIKRLLERYRRETADIELHFVDPDQHPDQVRSMGVTVEGELVIGYGGRIENVRSPDEEAVTNALQRLARSGERRLLFLSGHGERAPRGDRNFDFGSWAEQLTQKGFVVDSLNLGKEPAIPEGTAALVIADPRSPLLPGEVGIIGEWLAGGGNLLWLTEPDSPAALGPLAATLGIEPGPGTIVDPTGRLLGISHPAFVIVAEYPQHPVTSELATLTLFPIARPLLIKGGTDWQYTPLLRTLPRSWAESGPLEGSIAFDEDKERAGPLNVGVAATREIGGDPADGNGRSQRVAVIGDADFLSNQYLGNGANLELGNRLVNWLSHDDRLISIPPRTAPDIRLELTPAVSAFIGFGFLLVLPLALLGSGLAIWWRRRRR